MCDADVLCHSRVRKSFITVWLFGVLNGVAESYFAEKTSSDIVNKVSAILRQGSYDF